MIKLDDIVSQYEADVHAMDTAIYRKKVQVWSDYSALGLMGEIGEACEKYKKCLRDQGGVVTDALRHELLLELGDVCWYVVNLLYDCSLSLWDTNTLEDIDDRDYNPGYNSFGQWIVSAGCACAELINCLPESPDEVTDRMLTNIFAEIHGAARSIGSDLPTILQMNLDKLASRKERSVLQGSGDHR